MEDTRIKTPCQQNWGITWLRIFCALQVYGIHYFAGLDLRNYLWIFSLAVPTFLLMSAYLYGLRRTDGTKLGTIFVCKRFKSISAMTYPLLLFVFLFYFIKDTSKIQQYSLSLLGEITYFHEIIAPHLPRMGHLWFLQSLLMCYIAMAVTTNFIVFERIFKSPKILFLLTLIVLGCGFLYRGHTIPYIFVYLVIYYNAKHLRAWCKKNVCLFLFLIFVHFAVASTGYQKIYHYGIYLYYFQTLIFSIVLIILFQKIEDKLPANSFVSYCGELTMAFYLIHHLFAYDMQLFEGLTVTIILSICLNWIGKKIKKIVN